MNLMKFQKKNRCLDLELCSNADKMVYKGKGDSISNKARKFKISKKIPDLDFELCNNADNMFSEGKGDSISDEARKFKISKKIHCQMFSEGKGDRISKEGRKSEISKNHSLGLELCNNADKMSSKGKGDSISKEGRNFPTSKESTRNENSILRIMEGERNKIGLNNKNNPKQRSHLSEVLIDSMLGSSEVLEEKSCEPQARQPSTVHTLPLKFRFEDEDSKPAEKSECEIMVEDLFTEMYSWMELDMSNDSAKDANGKPNVCSVKENRLYPCLKRVP